MEMDGAFIGFGEAGMAFAGDAAWRGRAIAYDSKTDDPRTADAKQADYQACAVAAAPSAAEAAGKAGVVLSLVTADQAMAAAQACSAGIAPGAFYCDGNSAAPQTKQAAARIIEAKGAHYIDMAIMSPVHPGRLAAPLLLSGARAEEAERLLAALGFTTVRVVGEEVGRASTIKMLRSVMYKGVEALTAECLIACERAGVTGEVLGSFGSGVGSGDWASGADYRLDRMLVHGLRRAAEMDEVVKTLTDLGVEPLMTRGAAARQQQIGSLGLSPVPDGMSAKLERLKTL